MDVYLVWHVRHAPFLDGRPTEHHGEDGDLVWDEEDGDDLKILGVYSTEQKAEERLVRARELPGFRDEPDCFLIAPYTLDEDRWTEGFATAPRDT
ncbi:hypothetical protein AB0F81_39750 [Actinoplanes sp. NPDC024001]|uniref:DUF7336 domain-containing protein n=1 Tax=Actinoplanes sp. NPDC024001 TaxID=3154598 RepID=UPI0033D33A88